MYLRNVTDGVDQINWARKSHAQIIAKFDLQLLAGQGLRYQFSNDNLRVDPQVENEGHLGLFPILPIPRAEA